MLIRFALQSALLSLFAVALCACGELHPLPTLRIDRDASPEASADAVPVTDAPAVDTGADATAPDAPADASAEVAQADASPDVQPDAQEPTDTAPDVPDVPDVPTVDVLAPPDAAPDVVTCPSGFERCDGVCVDTFSATNHCGMCGRTCALSNAVAVCRSALCAMLRCSPGFANCDGDAENGCEVDVRTSREHCGACGASCAVFAHVCADGACLEDHSFQPVAPCLRESDYVRGDAVRFVSGGYTPRCLRVRRGDAVSFTVDFGVHTVAGMGNATTPTAIPYLAGAPRGVEWTQSVAMDRAGYFPYRCLVHDGETGVVWVE